MLKLENLSVKLGRKSSPLFSINSVHEPGPLLGFEVPLGPANRRCFALSLDSRSQHQEPSIFSDTIYGALLLEIEIGFELNRWE